MVAVVVTVVVAVVLLASVSMVKVLPDHVAGAEVRGVEIVVVHADPVGIGGQVTAEAATVGVGAATMTAGVAQARPFATVRRDVVRPFMVPQSNGEQRALVTWSGVPVEDPSASRTR
jgi:hypothetical protein